MMPKVTRQWIFACGLTAGVLMWLQPVARGQVSFYSGPGVTGFGGNTGGGEGEGGTGGGDGGLDLGIFAQKPFKFNISARQGYDSNTNTTKTDPQASMYTNVGAGLNYSFGTPRLQLGASLGGGVTYYYTRPGDNVDLNATLGVSATYRATPRLNLSLSTSTAYLSQPDVSIVGGTNRQDGNYFISNTTISGAYQWTDIISSVTSYNFSAIYYEDGSLNENQGNISQTFAQSINWLWKPKTTLVAEYRINTINYYSADLNQLGNYFLVGFDQIFNPRFYWNARLGAQVNFNNNPTDGQSVYIGPFMESTLRYQLGHSTSVSWNMRYGTEQSGIDDVTQRQTFRTSVNLEHSFTARLSGSMGLTYLCNYYNQSGVITTFFENIVEFSVGLRFKVNRFAALEAGYQFTTDIAPEDTGREYNRNIVFVGTNFSF